MKLGVLAVVSLQWVTPITSLVQPRASSRLHSSAQSTRLWATEGPTVATSEEKAVLADDISETDSLICGGGPAGLLSAIMLAQKYPDRKVRVYDRLSAPPSPTDEAVWGDVSKFYLIGLGGRGQTSLAKFGVWEDVENACTAVVGRKDWAPESDEAVERIFTDRKFKTQVLPRDKLVSVLYKHIVDNYGEQVELNYGYEVRPVDFGESKDSKSVKVEILKCQGESESDLDCDLDASSELVSAGLMIAADGTARTFANEMEEYATKRKQSMNPIRRLFSQKSFKVTRYEDDNQRIYKTIPIKLPAGWRPDLNYSARSKGGRVNLDALPANRNGEYCGVLLLRKDDELAAPDVDPKVLRSTLDELLPMFSEIISDEVVAQVAKKPPSFLPAFRYVGPRLNQGDYTVVLGDCAHTVKPYFGLGANSALEDVKILSDCLDITDGVPGAVKAFSKRRAKDSELLVKISRDLDRPGTLGTITFIIPIILDSIFNKIAPKIFSPNVISMLQRDDLTFQQVARMKRTDRILQLSAIGGSLTAMGMTAKYIIRKLAQAIGRKSSTVFGTMVAAAVGVAFAKKLLQFMVPGMAPADVLAKSKSKITNEKEQVTDA